MAKVRERLGPGTKSHWLGFSFFTEDRALEAVVRTE